MLQAEKVIIAQHAIPEDTNETTQVKELLGRVDLTDAVVTGDAAHSHRATAQYIAAPADEGGRGSDYFLYVKGNEPTLQRAVYDAIQAPGARKPDFCEMDYGHGRIIKRSLWVTGAGGLDFPYVTRVVRIQRDGYCAAPVGAVEPGTARGIPNKNPTRPPMRHGVGKVVCDPGLRGRFAS